MCSQCGHFPGTLVTLVSTCACRHWISSPSLKFLLLLLGLEGGVALVQALRSTRLGQLPLIYLAVRTCQEACGGWGQGIREQQRQAFWVSGSLCLLAAMKGKVSCACLRKAAASSGINRSGSVALRPGKSHCSWGGGGGHP